MEDLASFDEDLSDCLYKLPTENLPLVSVGHPAMKPVYVKTTKPVSRSV